MKEFSITPAEAFYSEKNRTRDFLLFARVKHMDS